MVQTAEQQKPTNIPTSQDCPTLFFIIYLFYFFYFKLSLLFIYLLFFCFWFTTLDGLYPQAYDLISIFSIFMEVSNIWLKRIEYEKSFRPVKWDHSGNNLKPSSKFTRMKFPKKKSYLISFQEVKTALLFIYLSISTFWQNKTEMTT